MDGAKHRSGSRKPAALREYSFLTGGAQYFPGTAYTMFNVVICFIH